MSEIEIKNGQGKVVGKHKIADPIAKLGTNNNLLHRTVIAEQANSRQGTHSAKTRSEARGGGRKPYKQKKTGNARQGTIRAPHYAHGGMAFAIKPRDYTKGDFKFDADGDGKPGSDADIMLVIKNGAAAYGGSAMMMPNPTVSDADLKLLVAYIRSLKQ